MKEVGSVCSQWLPCLHPNQDPTDMSDDASDSISQSIADCWPAPAPFIFHLPVKYYNSVAKRCLCDHFQDNAAIFFVIISGRCLHCFIGNWDSFNLLPKGATLDEARRQRVRMILSSRKAGFISSLFVCPGVEDSWQPPICLWWTSISLCWIERQRGEQVTSSAGLEKGWALVMNIMCKYERRETKGCFCYANVGIGADWARIRCVCVFTRGSVCACMCMRSCMDACIVEMTQWKQTC